MLRVSRKLLQGDCFFYLFLFLSIRGEVEQKQKEICFRACVSVSLNCFVKLF